jgi:hypothetical protein
MTQDEILQAITDPENQPSQFGTVTLDFHFEKIKKWEDLFERMSDKVLAQRTWIGLTNEEVELYWDWEDFQCGCGPSTLFAMVRDIEARLKNRNI